MVRSSDTYSQPNIPAISNDIITSISSLISKTAMPIVIMVLLKLITSYGHSTRESHIFSVFCKHAEHSCSTGSLFASFLTISRLIAKDCCCCELLAEPHVNIHLDSSSETRLKNKSTKWIRPIMVMQFLFCLKVFASKKKQNCF